MSLIKFQHVAKEFKGRVILKDLHFTLERNEIVALIGENGAGKTTAIRLLLGISKPSKGHIERWSDDYKKKTGAQLQATPFFEDYSVEDNLKLFAAFYQVKLDQKKIADILDRYQLKAMSHTAAGKLSLGQQKRLAISITTLHGPDLVVLDEPSAGLDPRGQRDIQRLIQQLKAQGKSILFASHDMLEVRSISDRILMLHDGKIVISGSPETLLKAYQEDDLEALFYRLTKKEVSYG